MVRFNSRQKSSTKPRTVRETVPNSFDCPHCGELIELDANFKPLAATSIIPLITPVISVAIPDIPVIITQSSLADSVTQPVSPVIVTQPIAPVDKSVSAAKLVSSFIVTQPIVPLSSVKATQTDSSSRLRYLLDQPLPNEAAAEVVEVKPVEKTITKPSRPTPKGQNLFSSAIVTLAGSLLFLVFALGLGVVVYNSTAPQVTPAVNLSIPTRNPTKEALQNKPVPADQTQAPVFLATATTEDNAATPPQVTQLDINQPAITQPPTAEATQAPTTAPIVLGPAFGTAKPSDLSGVANSSNGNLSGNRSGIGTVIDTSSLSGAITTAPISGSGSGGGANSAAPTLPTRTFAPAPPILQVNGQSGRVYQVAFSTDGKSLATANDDNSVRLWDAATGKQTMAFWGHTGSVYTLAFSPNGQFLASAGADRSVLLWNIATGKLIRKIIGHTAEINSVIFSPGGQILATGSTDLTIRLWDVNTGQQVGIGQGHQGPVQTVVFSPDGKTLASGADDQLIMLWDLNSLSKPTLRATLKGHTSRIFLVAFSPDGKLLASASLDTSNNLKVWDLGAGKELVNLTGHDQAVYSVVFSPEGKLLASGGLDRTVRLWDPNSGTLLGTYTGASGTITSIAFSPDGKTLVGAGVDQIIRLWKVDPS